MAHANHDEKGEGTTEGNKKFGEAYGANHVLRCAAPVDEGAGNNRAPATTTKRIEETTGAG